MPTRSPASLGSRRWTFTETRIISARACAIEDAAHALRGHLNVVDIQAVGVLATIEPAPASGKPGQRGAAAGAHCYADDVLIRAFGDTLVVSPPLTIVLGLVQDLFETIGASIAAAA